MARVGAAWIGTEKVADVLPPESWRGNESIRDEFRTFENGKVQCPECGVIGTVDRLPHYPGCSKRVMAKVVPWGHKLTIHIYIEGERTDYDAVKATQAACDSLEAEGAPLDFAGAQWNAVREKPHDQIAT